MLLPVVARYLFARKPWHAQSRSSQPFCLTGRSLVTLARSTPAVTGKSANQATRVGQTTQVLTL